MAKTLLRVSAAPPVSGDAKRSGAASKRTRPPALVPERSTGTRTRPQVPDNVEMDPATHNKIASFIWGEEGGIEAFIRREVLAQISADILAIVKEAEGLLDGLLVQGERA